MNSTHQMQIPRITYKANHLRFGKVLDIDTEQSCVFCTEF